MDRRQDGYLRKRFGGWHVVYYATENGVRKQKSRRLCDDGKTKSQAKDLREEFMRDIRGQSEEPMGVVAFWDDVYLPFIESNGNLKPATVHGYKQVWKQHLKSHFGKTQLADYKTHMMSNFLTGLAKTLRPRTLDRIKWLASSIFGHAVATGACEVNPIRDAKVLGKTLGHGDTKSYTLEEMENVISALVDRVDAQLVMALSFFAGMRKGEIQGLQWSDIDGDCIHIRRAFSRGVVGVPKSKKSVRAIPIIQPVRIPLMLWRSKACDGGWVFPNSDGNAWDMANFATKAVKPALKKAGIEWRGYHAGRRGLGTTLRSITGNSTAGRDVLGHTTTRVTEAHYEHTLPEDALRGMKLLEAKSLSTK
jgi:integrase